MLLTSTNLCQFIFLQLRADDDELTSVCSLYYYISLFRESKVQHTTWFHLCSVFGSRWCQRGWSQHHIQTFVCCDMFTEASLSRDSWHLWHLFTEACCKFILLYIYTPQFLTISYILSINGYFIRIKGEICSICFLQSYEQTKKEFLTNSSLQQLTWASDLLEAVSICI